MPNSLENSSELSSHAQSFIDSAKELKKKFPEEFRKLFLFELEGVTAIPVRNKIGWWALQSDPTGFNVPKLKLLHHLMYSSKYIECSYEEFEEHFIGDDVPYERVKWLGGKMVFVFLFYRLR